MSFRAQALTLVALSVVAVSSQIARAETVPNTQATFTQVTLEPLRVVVPKHNPTFTIFPQELKLPGNGVWVGASERPTTSAVLPNLLSDMSPATATSMSLFMDFEGIDDTGWYPADVDIAVGYNVIIQVANSSLRIIDKCGTLLAENTFAVFMNDYTNLFYHPRVDYDESAGRWVITVLGINNVAQTSSAYTMISQSGDPLGSWVTYQIDLHLGTPSTWGDAIEMSIGPDAIYYTTNQWTWGPPTTFYEARFFFFDKSAMYQGGAASGWTFSGLTNPADGSPVFSLQPAKHNSWDGSFYLVNSKPDGADWFTMWKHTGAPSSGTINSYNVNVATYNPPPDLIQPDGSTIELGDCRITDAVFNLDTLWTSQTDRVNHGEVQDRSAVLMTGFIASTQTQIRADAVGTIGAYHAFPGFDMDEYGRAVLCFTIGGPTIPYYLSTRYQSYHLGSFGPYPTLQDGQANYSHAGSEPYRWGGRYGVDLDPVDYRTFWITGVFASNDPDPSWDTHIGAASLESPGALTVSPSAPATSVGLEGGPFTPPYHEYIITNTGNSAATWRLTDLDWTEADKVIGSVGPGQNDTVHVAAGSPDLPPGQHSDFITFENCLSGSTVIREIVVLVVANPCPGATLLFAPDPYPGSYPDDNQERGMYVTAIEDFEVCAIGMSADLEIPQEISARIYEANGTVRGALVADGGSVAAQAGEVFHFVPVSYTLKACKDYEITFAWGTANIWSAWVDLPPELPFDRGPIRVRDGSLGGDPSNVLLPYMAVIGGSVECEAYAELSPPGETPSYILDTSNERGLFVTAEKTLRTCNLGFEADVAFGEAIIAKIYEAEDSTRGDLIAFGSTISEGGGVNMIQVPVSALLHEGHDYDFSIEFPSLSTYAYFDKRYVTIPYQIEDAITVVSPERLGLPSTVEILRVPFRWNSGAGGAPFPMAKHDGGYPPPNWMATAHTDRGAYVTSLIDQNVYSLGWHADVPEGASIGARIYEAAGTMRGGLICQGSVQSAGPGLRWHDVPVTATLSAGFDYDFEINITEVNEWGWWSDETGMPYTVQGVIQVRDAEHAGDPLNVELIDMRMNACDAVLTSVPDTGPDHTPAFYLAAPFPNPSAEQSTIDFSVDEEGPLTIAVYDVTGRKIATVLQTSSHPAGPGRIAFDSRALAAGVYFIKMDAASKSVARKVVIVR